MSFIPTNTESGMITIKKKEELIILDVYVYVLAIKS